LTKIKICGLSRAEDIEYANICRPDYIGCVFAPSKRRVSIDKAKELRGLLDPKIITVGVFVNEDVHKVAEIFKAGIIDMAQLHGDEDAVYIGDLRCIVDIPIIKAIQVDGVLRLPDMDPDYFLFDAPSASVRGGSGEMFCWDSVSRFYKDFFLAGGINAGNVETAIRKLDPFCVDVSSGVETDGKKDLEKMREMVRLVRRCNDD
jgi:phosphoribosylanthranilate isomerase